MEDLVKEIVRAIVDVADPDRIILFGSRGDGCAGAESDFDVLVLKEGQYHRRHLAHRIYRALVDTGASVDVIVETPELAERYRRVPGWVYADAMRGRVVYERRSVGDLAAQGQKQSGSRKGIEGIR